MEYEDFGDYDDAFDAVGEEDDFDYGGQDT